MFKREPKARIETGEIPVLGQEGSTRESPPEKGRTTSRNLMIFKNLILVALMFITLYGMLDRGLVGLERLLPTVAAVLGLLFIALFVADYFAGIPRVAWILVGLLTVLVVVKGLSLTWSISQTETVNELLRSSMYLAAFVLAVVSLSSRRFVGPFIDGMILILAPVAGYGMLQKIDPVEYPSVTYFGTVRLMSTLGYQNTLAVVVAMGIVLGLGRMTQLRQPVLRGLYSALILVFLVSLYFTFSRGGMLALGVGLVVLFALSSNRLQMLTNLLLVAAPLVWLLQQVQSLETLFRAEDPEAQRLAEGIAFRTDLLLALAAAFLLQAVYAILAERYKLTPVVSRILGTVAIAGVLVGAGVGAYVLLNQQPDSDGLFGTFSEEMDESASGNERFTSLSSNSRTVIWRVAWEEWKEHPFTGTGAGTFMYTWLQERPGFEGVRQVHNVYLEQGTETGIFAFLALTGFAGLLTFHLARAALRASGERRILLAVFTASVVIYLVSSALEWHWYVPPSTIYFFVLAGVAVRFASEAERDT